MQFQKRQLWGAKDKRAEPTDSASATLVCIREVIQNLIAEGLVDVRSK